MIIRQVNVKNSSMVLRYISSKATDEEKKHKVLIGSSPRILGSSP